MTIWERGKAAQVSLNGLGKPAPCGRLAHPRIMHWVSSEHCDVFQQRDDTDYDDDNLRNLFCTGIERKPADQIKYENDNEERDQDADENRSAQTPTPLSAAELRRRRLDMANWLKGKRGEED